MEGCRVPETTASDAGFGGGMPATEISTGGGESSLRGDYWREFTQALFDVGASDESYRGAIESEFLNRSNVGVLADHPAFTAPRFLRSRKKAPVAGRDGYLVQLLTGGVRGRIDGNNVNLQVGDLYIFDLTRSCENYAGVGARLTMMIERERLEQQVGRADLHGLVFRRHHPITRLLTDYLTELLDVYADLSPADSLVAMDVVGRLIAAGLATAQPLLAREQDGDLTTLRTKILRFIDESLKHPELDAIAIMRRFHISRASLYRALEGDGGVATVIRERRLAAARDLLARSSGLQIAHVASVYGFSSQNQFFKAFRRKFGYAPSEVNGSRLAICDPFSTCFCRDEA